MSPATGDDTAFRNALRQRNIAALRIAAVIGWTIVPAFWALDWLVMPEHVTLLGVTRLLMAAYAVGIQLLISKRRAFAERNDTVLSQSLALIVAWAIELMVFLDTGYASPYYAGICLVFVTVGFLFTWPWRAALAFYACAYVPFILPAVLGIVPIGSVKAFVIHQFFLVSTMVIVFVSQRFRYNLERREFTATLALTNTKRSLEQALDKLRELDRAKNAFFNNITHELRTPITMILAPLEGLLGGEMGPVDAGTQKYFQAIWRNAMRLLRLINDLLDLAKMEERFLRLRLRNTTMAGVLEDIVEHTRPLAGRKGIDLHLDIRDRPDDLYVDTDMMERALINLLSNALKFTDSGGQVTLEQYISKDGNLCVSVTDTGVGIPPEALERIFTRFNQGDDSVTRRFGGTGLGLAISREIAELHGGVLTVRSTVRVGSTFTLRLPLGGGHVPDELVDSRPLPGGSDTGREPRAWSRRLAERRDYRFHEIEQVTERRLVEREDDRGKATKLLVVEDNLEILRFLHLQLADEHAVYLARNGVQGLELARREMPDVIVTDFMMPEMDGLTMLRELRRDRLTQAIPVIMLTARVTMDDRLEAREEGADVYLKKPFSPKELRAAINRQLERKGHEAGVAMQAQVTSLELISAGLAHELHNPLTYIKNSAVVIAENVAMITEELERDDGPDATRLAKARKRIARMIEVNDTGIKRIEQVVALVRRYSREGYPEEAATVALDSAIRDVVTLVAPRDERDVTVELQLEGEATVHVVPEELSQVIGNLVQNAVDAVADKGRVVVRTTRSADDQTTILEVSDDGPGIPRANLERIFVPFFSTKEGTGMGVGLAISKQVVERAGGTIRVDSAVNEGSRFTVSLPIKA